MPNTKAELRAKALARRDALSEKKRTAAAAKLARRGLPFKLLPGSVVSCYSPIRSEIDPMPLLARLAEEGARLALSDEAERPLDAATEKYVAAAIAMVEELLENPREAAPLFRVIDGGKRDD